jgi:hypothetical protein
MPLYAHPLPSSILYPDPLASFLASFLPPFSLPGAIPIASSFDSLATPCAVPGWPPKSVDPLAELRLERSAHDGLGPQAPSPLGSPSWLPIRPVPGGAWNEVTALLGLREGHSRAAPE